MDAQHVRLDGSAPGAKPEEEERDPVDEALEESFPASDPPAYEPLHAGPPADHPDPPGSAPTTA